MPPASREVLSFVFDPAEAVRGDDFLTPLYFHRQVLTRYLYDSRFRCEFASETYGTVYGPEFIISFGINKNGTVVAWKGDIHDLPVRERFYWLVENTNSEHDIASEFYDAQIEVTFTEPPAIITCLNKLEELNKKFQAKFGVHLYHDRSIEERIEETRRYKRLVLNNVDDFKRFISELNEIVTESVNNAEVKRLLQARGVTPPVGAKGNKLLQAVYEMVLGDKENLVAPFFYLYDLRLWADHALGDDKLNQVAQILGVDPNNFQQLVEALVVQLTNSANALIDAVEA